MTTATIVMSLIEQGLESGPEAESFAELQTRLAATCFDELLRSGFSVPAWLRQDVSEEIEGLVADIIRKKTYGHLSPQEYRQAKKRSTKTKSRKG
jgi:hypothetical protein